MLMLMSDEDRNMLSVYSSAPVQPTVCACILTLWVGYMRFYGQIALVSSLVLRVSSDVDILQR